MTQNGSCKLSLSDNCAILQETQPANVSGTDRFGEDTLWILSMMKSRYDTLQPMQQESAKHCKTWFCNFVILNILLVQGYFDQYEFDLPSNSILINLFETAVAGSLHIEDPKINLKITNSFGVPIEMVAENLTAETMSEGPMAVYTDLDNGIAFNYPTVMEVGQSRVTNVGVNKDNSNLSEIISSSPTQLNYELAAISNPASDPNIKGFVLDTSRFDVDVEMELPVYLSASDFAVEEVSEFDASFFEDIERAEFKLITENGLPIEAGVQVYFLDENNFILDSLFNTSSTYFNSGSRSECSRRSYFKKFE